MRTNFSTFVRMDRGESRTVREPETDRSRLPGNNTLVAFTLMIAESRTEEKEVMAKEV